MKYLVIEEKNINPKDALAIVREQQPKVKYPNSKRGIHQFFFPNSELTQENVREIAASFGMRIIKMSDARAVIGY